MQGRALEIGWIEEVMGSLGYLLDDNEALLICFRLVTVGASKAAICCHRFLVEVYLVVYHVMYVVCLLYIVYFWDLDPPLPLFQ